MKKKRGFTLVELIAVITILAVVLVIAVPKILNVIKESRETTLVDSARSIAIAAERKLLENKMFNKDDEITCDEVSSNDLSSFESCTITFDSNNKAIVNIEGKGKFKDMFICNGNRDKATIGYGECPLLCDNGYLYNYIAKEDINIDRCNDNKYIKIANGYLGLDTPIFNIKENLSDSMREQCANTLVNYLERKLPDYEFDGSSSGPSVQSNNNFDIEATPIGSDYYFSYETYEFLDYPVGFCFSDYIPFEMIDTVMRELPIDQYEFMATMADYIDIYSADYELRDFDYDEIDSCIERFTNIGMPNELAEGLCYGDINSDMFFAEIPDEIAKDLSDFIVLKDKKSICTGDYTETFNSYNDSMRELETLLEYDNISEYVDRKELHECVTKPNFLATYWQELVTYRMEVDDYQYNDNTNPIQINSNMYNVVKIEDGPFLPSSDDIARIMFYNTNVVDAPNIDGLEGIDVSEAQDGSIMAYIVESDYEPPYIEPVPSSYKFNDIPNVKKIVRMPDHYDIYIISDGEIYFPVDSSYMFAYFDNVKIIEFNNSINTFRVKDMSYMFHWLTLESLDLSSFKFRNSNVNIQNMFCSCDVYYEPNISIIFDTFGEDADLFCIK